MTKLKFIHVNQHIIKSNLKHGKNEPVFTIKVGRSGKAIKAFSVSTERQCLFSYGGNEKPLLPCGARVVASTYGSLVIENFRNEMETIK
tara:strand:- start:434 stop:700 length:267 start_codon:yes stop_codon:yes gene_type:complete